MSPLILSMKIRPSRTPITPKALTISLIKDKFDYQMSSFGTDDAVFMKAEDLVESPRFAEATSKNGMIAFTLKQFARDAKHSCSTNLHIFESGGEVKQMTRLVNGGVSNPVFPPDVLGSKDAVCFDLIDTHCVFLFYIC